MTLQPGTGAIVSPEGEADALLPYDARLRCSCTALFEKRCIRKATEGDLLCDDCRGDQHNFPLARYVTLPALRDHPSRVFAVLEEARGHAVLVAPLGEVVSDGLTWS